MNIRRGLQLALIFALTGASLLVSQFGPNGPEVTQAQTPTSCTLSVPSPITSGTPITFTAVNGGASNLYRWQLRRGTSVAAVGSELVYADATNKPKAYTPSPNPSLLNNTITYYQAKVAYNSTTYINCPIVQVKPATTTTTVSPPAFTASVGSTFPTSQSITMRTTTVGASIYYIQSTSPIPSTTNPTSSSTKYTVPITISATTYFKAVAILNGASSTVSSASYTKGSTSILPLSLQAYKQNPFTTTNAQPTTDFLTTDTIYLAADKLKSISTLYKVIFSSTNSNIFTSATNSDLARPFGKSFLASTFYPNGGTASFGAAGYSSSGTKIAQATSLQVNIVKGGTVTPPPPTDQVPTPSFTPSGGTFTTAQSVRINPTGTKTYYTKTNDNVGLEPKSINITDPRLSLWDGTPISTGNNGYWTIKAYSTETGKLASEPVTATYVLPPTPPISTIIATSNIEVYAVSEVDRSFGLSDADLKIITISGSEISKKTDSYGKAILWNFNLADIKKIEASKAGYLNTAIDSGFNSAKINIYLPVDTSSSNNTGALVISNNYSTGITHNFPNTKYVITDAKGVKKYVNVRQNSSEIVLPINATSIELLSGSGYILSSPIPKVSIESGKISVLKVYLEPDNRIIAIDLESTSSTTGPISPAVYTIKNSSGEILVDHSNDLPFIFDPKKIGPLPQTLSVTISYRGRDFQNQIIVNNLGYNYYNIDIIGVPCVTQLGTYQMITPICSTGIKATSIIGNPSSDSVKIFSLIDKKIRGLQDKYNLTIPKNIVFEDGYSVPYIYSETAYKSIHLSLDYYNGWYNESLVEPSYLAGMITHEWGHLFDVWKKSSGNLSNSYPWSDSDPVTSDFSGNLDFESKNKYIRDCNYHLPNITCGVKSINGMINNTGYPSESDSEFFAAAFHVINDYPDLYRSKINEVTDEKTKKLLIEIENYIKSFRTLN